MADLTNGSGVYATYNNSGTGVAELGDNYAAKSGQGIAGRTRVLSMSKTNISQAELDSLVRALGAGGTKGTDDAVTVVGVSAFEAGVTDVVYVAVQGTGALTAGADYRGVTGVTMAVVADFAGLQA